MRKLFIFEKKSKQRSIKADLLLIQPFVSRKNTQV
jgi:hypothetical protein